MGLKEFGFLWQNNREYVNCASVSLSLLSPRILTIDDLVAATNVNNFIAIVSILEYNLLCSGCITKMHLLNRSEKPSEVLKILDKQSQSSRLEKFLGGFLVTKDKEVKNGKTNSHVIAVISMHSTKSGVKVRIADTIVKNRLLIRKVPVSTLDRKAEKAQPGTLFGVFFTGLNIDLIKLAQQTGGEFAENVLDLFNKTQDFRDSWINQAYEMQANKGLQRVNGIGIEESFTKRQQRHRKRLINTT